MAKMTKAQKKVGKVMGEFKEGTLHSGKKGPVVKSRKQAIAIAMSEAGMKKPIKKAMGGMVNKGGQMVGPRGNRNVSLRGTGVNDGGLTPKTMSNPNAVKGGLSTRPGVAITSAASNARLQANPNRNAQMPAKQSASMPTNTSAPLTAYLKKVKQASPTGVRTDAQNAGLDKVRMQRMLANQKMAATAMNPREKFQRGIKPGYAMGGMVTPRGAGTNDGGPTPSANTGIVAGKRVMTPRQKFQRGLKPGYAKGGAVKKGGKK